MLSRKLPPYPYGKGMSLLELVVVLAIMGILLTAGLANFSVWVGNSQIRAVAEAQLAAVRSARNEAIKLNSPVQIQFDADFRGWTVTVVNTNTVLKHEANLADYVNITSAEQPAGANTIIFDGLGRVTLPAGNAPITQIDIDNIHIDAAESTEQRILISPVGGVRMCRPGKAAPDPAAC
mgnify:CR=1 FL=1